MFMLAITTVEPDWINMPEGWFPEPPDTVTRSKLAEAAEPLPTRIPCEGLPLIEVGLVTVNVEIEAPVTPFPTRMPYCAPPESEPVTVDTWPAGIEPVVGAAVAKSVVQPPWMARFDTAANRL
jgi:hypothetical protein